MIFSDEEQVSSIVGSRGLSMIYTSGWVDEQIAKSGWETQSVNKSVRDFLGKFSNNHIFNRFIPISEVENSNFKMIAFNTVIKGVIDDVVDRDEFLKRMKRIILKNKELQNEKVSTNKIGASKDSALLINPEIFKQEDDDPKRNFVRSLDRQFVDLEDDLIFKTANFLKVASFKNDRIGNIVELSSQIIKEVVQHIYSAAKEYSVEDLEGDQLWNQEKWWSEKKGNNGTNIYFQNELLFEVPDDVNMAPIMVIEGFGYITAYFVDDLAKKLGIENDAWKTMKIRGAIGSIESEILDFNDQDEESEIKKIYEEAKHKAGIEGINPLYEQKLLNRLDPNHELSFHPNRTSPLLEAAVIVRDIKEKEKDTAMIGKKVDEIIATLDVKARRDEMDKIVVQYKQDKVTDKQAVERLKEFWEQEASIFNQIYAREKIEEIDLEKVGKLKKKFRTLSFDDVVKVLKKNFQKDDLVGNLYGQILNVKKNKRKSSGLNQYWEAPDGGLSIKYSLFEGAEGIHYQLDFKGIIINERNGEGNWKESMLIKRSDDDIFGVAYSSEVKEIYIVRKFSFYERFSSGGGKYLSLVHVDEPGFNTDPLHNKSVPLKQASRDPNLEMILSDSVTTRSKGLDDMIPGETEAEAEDAKAKKAVEEAEKAVATERKEKEKHGKGTVSENVVMSVLDYTGGDVTSREISIIILEDSRFSQLSEEDVFRQVKNILVDLIHNKKVISNAYQVFWADKVREHIKELTLKKEELEDMLSNDEMDRWFRSDELKKIESLNDSLYYSKIEGEKHGIAWKKIEEKDKLEEKIKRLRRGVVQNDDVEKEIEKIEKQIEVISGVAYKINPDRAMMGQKEVVVLEDEAVKKPGGINLDAAMLDLQIKRDGNGVPLPLDMQDADLGMRVEGVLPVILRIMPINVIQHLNLIGLLPVEQEDPWQVSWWGEEQQKAYVPDDVLKGVRYGQRREV